MEENIRNNKRLNGGIKMSVEYSKEVICNNCGEVVGVTYEEDFPRVYCDSSCFEADR